MQTIARDEIKAAWFILLPNTKFKTAWNLLLILALLYTATVMPYNVAFIDDKDEPGVLKAANFLVDGFFWCDIILNFFSAYDRPNG